MNKSEGTNKMFRNGKGGQDRTADHEARRNNHGYIFNRKGVVMPDRLDEIIKYIIMRAENCQIIGLIEEAKKQITEWAKDNISVDTFRVWDFAATKSPTKIDSELNTLRKQFTGGRIDAIPCIKEIRRITSLGLYEAKKLYDLWKSEGVK